MNREQKEARRKAKRQERARASRNITVESARKFTQEIKVELFLKFADQNPDLFEEGKENGPEFAERLQTFLRREGAP